MFVLSALAAGTLTAQAPARAATVPYLCNYGRATSRISVHAAASEISRTIAHLSARAAVYICDDTSGWFEIRFAAPKRSCPRAKGGLDVRRATACSSGWVRREQVELVSG